MPIYEYVCDDCGKRHEQVVLSPKRKVACPGCSSKRQTLQLSVFAAHTPSNGPTGPRQVVSMGSCGCGAGGCGRH